jgi:hypothetical protein
MVNYGLCEECFESITHPVCKNCFIIQIENWLRDNEVSENEKKELIKRIKKEFSKEKIKASDEETICTICKKIEVSLCPYCFFLNVGKILEKLKISRRIRKEFLEVFNYRNFDDEFF